MANQLTIGILVTNTDRSEFAQNHDSDGKKFTKLMQCARPDWNYIVYECTEGNFPQHLDACDGYIIGGSPASVNDDAAWIKALMVFIRKLDAAKKPTVGCCFGHQATAVALGGKVEKNPVGWGFGVSPTHFYKPEPWMIPKHATLLLYAAHSEQVTVLPQNAIVVGGDDFCPYSSFKVGEHIFTTEYHPEMTKDFFVALTHACEKYIGVATAANARMQAQTQADGELFARWMANFLEMKRA